ncbi:MAG: hypothetical protein NZ585_05925 [Chloracidobacterium sp.]|nr:hypothetical protein [Chloracidobacterium sp.]MDW8216159.1 hypothetical protein [Acidobacteriota bacterium]
MTTKKVCPIKTFSVLAQFSRLCGNAWRKRAEKLVAGETTAPCGQCMTERRHTGKRRVQPPHAKRRIIATLIRDVR